VIEQECLNLMRLEGKRQGRRITADESPELALDVPPLRRWTAQGAVPT